MKKRALITFLFALATVGGLVSCGNNETQQESLISLNVFEKRMTYGEKLQLIAIYQNDGGDKVTWDSDNEKVALVQDGQVSAVGIGSATISATFKGQTVYCNVNVVMGDAVPSLELLNISDDEVYLVKNDKFNLHGQVFFDGNYFDCPLKYEIEDDSIIEINELNQIVAKNLGSTNIVISTNWKNFESSLLTKTIKINVTNDIVLFTNITIGDKTEISNSIDLSIVSNFENKNYSYSAIVEPYCLVNGVKGNVTYSISNHDVISYDDVNNIIEAKDIGSAVVTYTYFDETTNLTYSTNIKVNVYSPVEVYKKEVVELCTEEAFPIEKYFASGAKLVSASQSGKALTVNKETNVISGINCKGGDTMPITVETNKGTYVFTSLFCYDRAITKDNIRDSLTLKNEVIDKYFVLNEDISDADMTAQKESITTSFASYNSYFAGTFDGRGHKIEVLVALNGMFGGFGNGATIKNTHFHFNFTKPNPNANVCGFARNAAVWVLNNVVYFDNIYVTASNFTQRCYTIYDMKIADTRMNNVYIDLSNSGIENLPTFTNTATAQGCLYNVDNVLINGAGQSFTGGVKNTYIVSGTGFMPLGCATYGKSSDGSDNLNVSYAKNDSKYLGIFTRGQSASVNAGYCIAIYDKTHKEYFGHIASNVYGTDICYLYEGQNNKAEWGIYRYDSNNALKTSGVTKIGDWSVR